MITIEEMLRIPTLEPLEVIAGHGGLTRKISTVSVMDALDIYNWMKGGEFLITSGGPIKDDPGYLSSLLEKLNEHGASAFGIKTQRFLGIIPVEAIKMADRLEFPLIYIPEWYAFVDIINPVLEEVISRQASQLRYSEKIHRSFTTLALSEEPIEKILETLAQIICRPAAFYDAQFSKLFVPSHFEEFYQELMRLPDQQKNYLFYQEHYHTHEISNETTNYGLIILGEDGGISKENQNIALEHAGTILILDTQKRLHDNQTTSRFRDEFIYDIIYNNINSEIEFHNRADLYNWDFRDGGLVVIVDIDHFKQNYVQKIDNKENLHLEISMHMMYRSITYLMKTQLQGVAYSKLNDYMIFIVYQKEDQAVLQRKLQQMFVEVQRELKQKMGLTATIAAGRYKKNPMELYQSYDEAKKSIQISHNMGISDTIVFYQKLGIYKLINLVLNTEEASELLESYIYKLKSYDEKNNNRMLETLIVICENSWNLKLASNELFVHYNTIKYRYSKIGQILDVDFKCMDDRINVEVAIKIYQMMPV